MRFNLIKPKNIKYVKISCIDYENEKYELKTSIKEMTDALILLRYRCNKQLKSYAPQYTLAKFVTDEAMYVAQTEIQKIGIFKKTYVDIQILKPKEVQRRQLREYYRVALTKAVAITCTKKEGEQEVFLAKTVDLSAGGVKVSWLKSLQDGKRIEKTDFRKFNEISISLYLDSEIPIVFDATFVRFQPDDEGVSNFAFEFKNPNLRYVNQVAKYVDDLRASQRDESIN
ncbi:MAG: PilZ domain-containing protein [bacterium]|nr:PilZ domain-containing protein [bacterium]